MANLPVHLPQPNRLLQTSRRDTWWFAPLLTFSVLLAFIIYATWAAFQGAHFFHSAGGANYLSPFYSPLLFDVPGQHTHHAWFGQAPQWLLNVWPSFLPFSPALFILWAPGGFRFTCYYYRGAYYKAFWGDPPACAVGEPSFRGKKYLGEQRLPLILQNVHRYFMYLAIPFIAILAWDAFQAYRFYADPVARSEARFGVGVGSLILTLNPILLGGYTLGCHSLRHLVGGKKDCISSPVEATAYRCVTCLNRRHMAWAWVSLIWVAFSDVYVRLCSMGIWTDYRLL